MNKKKHTKGVMDTLLEISEKTGFSLELEKVTKAILKHAKAFLNADYSALFVLDDQTKRLMLIAALGFKNDELENLKILGSCENFFTELIKKRKVLAVNDISKNITFKDKDVPFSKEKLPLGAFLAVPLEKHGKVIGVLVVSNNKKKRNFFSQDDKKLIVTLANHVYPSLLNAKLYKELQELFMNTVTSLVRAIDARDKYTHGHSERVAEYACAIAKEMDCEAGFIENLRLSGILHDIGKIGIRDKILSKSGPLTRKEQKEISKHCFLGSKIVDSVINYRGVIRGIEEHHERFDGKGYPKKIKGKLISLESRIISLADTFDSLTTNRPYNKVHSPKEALFEIIRNSSTQFDPKVVKAFQRSVSKYPDLWQF